jgi:hypothetical protein
LLMATAYFAGVRFNDHGTLIVFRHSANASAHCSRRRGVHRSRKEGPLACTGSAFCVKGAWSPAGFLVSANTGVVHVAA